MLFDPITNIDYYFDPRMYNYTVDSIDIATNIN